MLYLLLWIIQNNKLFAELCQTACLSQIRGYRRLFFYCLSITNKRLQEFFYCLSITNKKLQVFFTACLSQIRGYRSFYTACLSQIRGYGSFYTACLSQIRGYRSVFFTACLSQIRGYSSSIFYCFSIRNKRLQEFFFFTACLSEIRGYRSFNLPASPLPPPPPIFLLFNSQCHVPDHLRLMTEMFPEVFLIINILFNDRNVNIWLLLFAAVLTWMYYVLWICVQLFMMLK